ncbi:odorant receptor 43a-like [Lycorma delicatula]|uniref:odorant receptor 43a-like n=1 Tax=Lycorma delicatula TaxID=130591 RepID=UPI003F512D21
MKIGYFISALSEILILYAYCTNGQKIINESDELRRAMGECPWLDKPLWFKKMLLLMMTKAQATLQIKPFGLYVVCLNNFVGILNGAYSYFNLLRTVK